MRTESRMRRFTRATAVGLALLLLAGCPKDDSEKSAVLIESLQSEGPGRRWEAIIRAERLQQPTAEVIEKLKTIFVADPEIVIRAQALRALEKHGAVDDPILRQVAGYAWKRHDYLGFACFDLLKSRGPDILKQVQTYAAGEMDLTEQNGLRVLENRLKNEMDD